MSNSNLWKLNLIKLRINFPSLPSLVTNSEWEAGYRYFENSNWYICSLFFLFWVKIILGNLGWFKHMHSFNFCAYYTCTNICIFNHQDRSLICKRKFTFIHYTLQSKPNIWCDLRLRGNLHLTPPTYSLKGRMSSLLRNLHCCLPFAGAILTASFAWNKAKMTLLATIFLNCWVNCRLLVFFPHFEVSSKSFYIAPL